MFQVNADFMKRIPPWQVFSKRGLGEITVRVRWLYPEDGLLQGLGADCFLCTNPLIRIEGLICMRRLGRLFKELWYLTWLLIDTVGYRLYKQRRLLQRTVDFHADLCATKVR